MYPSQLLGPLIVLIAVVEILSAQIDPNGIDIVRDSFGVPHIYATTDDAVAYGFGWASAEDDFKTLQQQLLPVRGLSGVVMGKKAAALDVAFHLIEGHAVVDAKYQTDLSADFRQYLASYCAGVNAYAKSHPKEVLHKKLFPVAGQDIIKAFVLGLTALSHADDDLIKLVRGKIKRAEIPKGNGSNAFAISASKTKDGRTYLAINSHQPLEGLNSWYEAHLCSDEGLNMLGATFVGSPVLSIGVNENLGWCHTLNYPDLSDVFQLEMHPTDPLLYKFDDRWERLVPYDVKATIKLLGIIKIGAKQKFWKSKYGVTYQTPLGYFSHRFAANQDIRAAEQWFRMSKSKNWTEFRSALDLQGLPSMNLVYADKDDHIFYLGNGRFPYRNKKYDWTKVVPGNSSETLWSDQCYPIDSLPQVLDPVSGYVYNCNHTPFLSSGDGDNPVVDQIPVTAGYQPPAALTNRAVRLQALLNEHQAYDYATFKKIKYDLKYHTPLLSAPKLEPIFHLNADIYPHLKSNIELLRNWDREAGLESDAASIFILALQTIRKKARRLVDYRLGEIIDEKLLVLALEDAQNHCLKHFKKLAVPLRDLQRHTRGQMDLPIAGGPDVLAALSASTQKNGTLRARAGDSYIELVRFSKEGVEIESVNAFGASAIKTSAHYTDQMKLYTQQKLKKMTLDKEEVYASALRIYHPK